MNSQDIMFLIFGVLSFAFLIASLCNSIKKYREKNREIRLITSLQWFTLGVFISTVLVFIPIYYWTYDFKDSIKFVRPFLISIHHAFRVFILDGEFNDIIKGLPELNECLHVAFSGYAAFLYVIAPILTFSIVLSLFANVINRIRFLFHKKRPFYIFSELNERSVTLAESIAHDENIKKPIIVFTDVFKKEEEGDYELLLRARDLRAILLKNDITRLNVNGKSSYIEFFLIGDNESENTEHAIKLTNIYKDCKKRAVYLFSSKQSSGYVLDSLDKGKRTFSTALEKISDKNAEDVLSGNALSADFFNFSNFEDGLYLRRIDTVALLPINVLSDDSLVKVLSDNTVDVGNKNKKHISIMIIGTGEYGKAFLKTALWLYQQCDYCVEISVLDKEEHDVIAGKLRKECPDLIFDKKVFIYGESNYHIRIISKIDVDSAKLGDLFASEENKEWIERTQLAIVSLGDDDKNIETAVNLRKLFDGVKGVDNESRETLENVNELPLIYSIVYNEKKASNLTISSEVNDSCADGIKNYKGTPYHIRFVGSLKDQYSYAVIKDLKNNEKDAIKYHLEWVGQIIKLREIYNNPEYNDKWALDFREKARKYFAEKSEEWGDEYFFGKTDDGKADYSKICTDQVKKSISFYMNYEYYRNSSIAKSVYKKHVYKAFCGVKNDSENDEEHSFVCMCDRCRKRRICEHMRWNAYMRTIGYKTGDSRSDRGLIHPNLIPWEDLPLLEQYKD